MALHHSAHSLRDIRFLSAALVLRVRRDPPALRPVTVAIAVIGGLLLFAARWSVRRVLGVCAVLGLLAGLAGLPVA